MMRRILPKGIDSVLELDTSRMIGQASHLILSILAIISHWIQMIDLIRKGTASALSDG